MTVFRTHLTRPAAGGTLIALSCAGFLAAPAAAQNADERATRLGTVAVTDTAIDESYNRSEAASPKQTAPLVNLPQTVNIVPAEVIRDQGGRNLTEVLRNTPGISFEAGENGFATTTNNFQIRGFDASNSVFVDGARDSGSYARDIFNVERVEIFKGPTADNGRGGAGGYVNLVTKLPTLGSFMNADIGVGFDDYGTRARKRGTVDANAEIGGTAAVRLNAVVEDSGISGRDLARREVRGIAPSIAIGLGNPLRAYLAYEHLSLDDLPDWGVPGATVEGLFPYAPATAGARRDAFYGLADDFDRTGADVLLGRVEYDLSGAATLSNQTRWSKVDRRARYTVPFGYDAATNTAVTQTQFYARRNEALTNLTNLALGFDTGAVAHTVAIGVEYSRETSEADRFGTVTPPNADIFDPNPRRAVGAPFNATQTNDVRVTTIAAYLYDTIELSPAFQITAGIRGENYKVRIDSRTLAGAPTGVAEGYEEDRFWLGGKLGLVYKPAENGSLYASFGTGGLPPGSFLSNPDISRTGDNAFPGFVPGARTQRLLNYEVGVKWDFMDGLLSTSAALFRTEKRNAPVTGRQPGDTADSLQGYGRQIVQGLELGVVGQVTPNWNVLAGLTWLDSKRRHSAELDEARRRANPADYDTFLTTGGDRLAFTPEVTANLWTTYRTDFGLTVGGGVRHVGSSFVGRPDDALRFIPNGRYGKVPSHTLVDLMAAFPLTDNLELRVNVDNVFDKTYAVTTNWNANRATLGAPRTYLVTAGLRF